MGSLLSRQEYHPPSEVSGWGSQWESFLGNGHLDELYQAITAHDSQALDILSSLGDPNFCNIQQVYPIHMAAEHSNLTCLEHLIHLAADVNVRDKCMFTPLHLAAGVAGDVKSVERLATNGANLNARDIFGRTALHYAVINRQYNTAQALLQLGCDPSVADESGRVPLHCAASYGQITLISGILDSGGKIDQPDDYGRTAFYLALVARDRDTMQWLVNHGSNVDIITKGDTTPLVYASRKGQVEFVEFLLDHGARIQGIPWETLPNSTPLYASMWRCLDGRHHELWSRALRCAKILIEANGVRHSSYYLSGAVELVRKSRHPDDLELAMDIIYLLLMTNCRPESLNLSRCKHQARVLEAIESSKGCASLQLLACREIRFLLTQSSGNVRKGLLSLDNIPQPLQKMIGFRVPL